VSDDEIITRSDATGASLVPSSGRNPIEGWRVVLYYAFGMLAIATIGEVDDWTGPHLSLSLFYLVPISALAWRVGRTAGLSASVVAATAWYLADMADRVYPNGFYALWNGGVRLGVFLVVTVLLANLREALERERQLAALDPLTALPNRRAFFEAAQERLKSVRKQKLPIAIAFLDIDGFKGVNDHQGHASGDELLKEVAHSLRRVTRTRDLVARLGGDEFVVLLTEADAEVTDALIRRMDEALIEGARRGGWPVSFSIGRVVFDEVPADIDAMVHAADAQMYGLKRQRAALRSQPD